MAWNNYRRPMTLHSSATPLLCNDSAALFSSHHCLLFLFVKTCQTATYMCVSISVAAGLASVKTHVAVLEVSRFWPEGQRCRKWKGITFGLNSREYKRKCHMYSYNHQFNHFVTTSKLLCKHWVYFGTFWMLQMEFFQLQDKDSQHWDYQDVLMTSLPVQTENMEDLI